MSSKNFGQWSVSASGATTHAGLAARNSHKRFHTGGCRQGRSIRPTKRHPTPLRVVGHPVQSVDTADS
jgi:hypothetical protein